MNTTDYHNFLQDVGALLRARALAAKVDRNRASGEQRLFEQGRLFAYLETISLLQQELDAFGIERAEMQLDGIEPERDLL